MNNTFEHIKDSVPPHIQSKMFMLAAMAKNELIGDFNECYSSDGEIENISGVAYDGFMPFQDGGFEVNAFYRNDTDESYHFSKKQTEFNERQYDDLINSFTSDFELDSGWTWDDLTNELQESFSQYECEWFEPCLLSFQVFADGETVTVRLSVNYRDMPYYREKYAEDLISNDYNLAEFQALECEQLIKIMRAY